VRRKITFVTICFPHSRIVTCPLEYACTPGCLPRSPIFHDQSVDPRKFTTVRRDHDEAAA
jgi:hypothetical protein